MFMPNLIFELAVQKKQPNGSVPLIARLLQNAKFNFLLPIAYKSNTTYLSYLLIYQKRYFYRLQPIQYYLWVYQLVKALKKQLIF